MSTRTLLLSSYYLPVRVLHWQDAIKMVYEGTVRVVVEYDETVSSPSVTWKVPAVIALKRSVRKYVKGAVKFSRRNVYARDSFRCQYCLVPEHKVLTSDLRWVPLGDMRPGDTVVGFDEHSRGPGCCRRFVESVVESHAFEDAEIYRVILDDGTMFKVTSEHRWLARTSPDGFSKWVTTAHLYGKYVPRFFDPWRSEETRDAGWLAGIFDGEGWLGKRKMNLAAAQNPGLVLEHIKRALSSRGFGFTLAVVSGKCIRVHVTGSNRDRARLLGAIRPERLIETFKVGMLGRLETTQVPRVVSISPAGRGQIVKMKTSSATFIAEGFAHHNCGGHFSEEELTYDHVVPKSGGGRRTWTNIVSSCRPCNSRKGNRSCDDSGMFPRRSPEEPNVMEILSPVIDPSNAPEEWLDFLGGMTLPARMR